MFAWRVKPLEMELVESNYFRDETIFPRGRAAFDSAFLVEGLPHEWHGHPAITVTNMR